MRAWIAMIALLAGCAPEIPDGYYACNGDTECPEGLICRADGRCWRTPDALDAGARDAAPTPDDAAVDAGLDAGDLDAGTDAGGDACVPLPVDVDLLVVVDNSNSMVEEQLELAGSFRQLVDGLVTGDVDGDLVADFAPIDSLHVGVVSTDMGTGGHTVPTCARAMHGDDGVLVGDPRAPDCSGSFAPPFIAYEPPGGLSRLDEDFSCLARLGTGGCGFEQQLEATLKAVTPSDSAVRFFDNTVGHADGANAGFLREGSVLITLLVTDEEDCSAADPDLFELDSPTYTADLNLRCTEHSEALFDTDRYVDWLLDVGSGDHSQLVFAALMGMPSDLHGATPEVILADSRMQYRPSGTRLIPACSSPAGEASPGRRYVEVAQGLEAEGARTLLRSICEEDFSQTVEALLSTMAPSLSARCR